MADVRSLCNPQPPRFPEAAQKAALTGVVYMFKERAAWLKSCRAKVSTAEATHLFLIALPPGKKRNNIKARVADLLAVYKALKKRSVPIIETSTGRNSCEDWSEMLLDARKAIGLGRPWAAENGRASKGRPPHDYDPALKAKGELLWHQVGPNKKFKTRKVALVAINKLGFDPPMTRGYAYLTFGK